MDFGGPHDRGATCEHYRPMSRGLLFVAALSVVPMRAAAHDRGPDPARRRGGYVHIAPVSAGTVPIPDVFATTFGVAADAGWHFRKGRRFAMQIGVRADHHRLLADVRARQSYGGLQLRFGKIFDDAPTVFAYGTGSLGATVSDFGAGEWVGLGGLVGGGVQFLLRRRVTVGLEGGPQLGGEVWAQLRAHVFVGAWF